MSKWTKAEVAAQRRHREVTDECAPDASPLQTKGTQVVARFEQVTGRLLSQPVLSKLEGFPGSDRAPRAGELMGLAMVYAAAPLRLVDADTLDELDPHERSVLVRCNVAFVPPHPPSAGAAAARVDSLVRSEPLRVPSADGKLESESR